MDAHDAPPVQKQPREDAEADQLAERRSQRRACDAHVKDENEQRVERNVQQASRADAVHGQRRLALGAQRVVQHERRAHDRRGQQNDARVAFRVREDRFR